MKLSRLTPQELAMLTAMQKTEIVFGGMPTSFPNIPVAILLGSEPSVCRERAEGAAMLYQNGTIRKIVPSGGVEWDIDGKRMCECDIMCDILRARGVSDEDILPDRMALTTVENMICGMLAISRWVGTKSIPATGIITSEWHFRRAFGIAKLYLPNRIDVYGYPIKSPDCNAQNWHLSEENIKRIDTEIQLLYLLTKAGAMDDIEF